jgi:lysozyme
MKGKRILTFGIIIFLTGLLIYTTRKEIYRFGKQFLKSYSVENNRVIKDNESIWGIDISHHQTKINWNNLVEQNKPDFIFLKCTEGITHQDSKYKEYKKKAQQYDILVGAYHFFSYQTSGKAQAENFIKHAKLTNGDLIPVLDLEYVKNRKSYKNKIGEIKAFCKKIKSEYGVNPIIYCECDYKQSVLGPDFDHFTFWISDLYREPRCDYVFWQYTDKGNVTGIGNIDNNKLKDGLPLEDYLLGEKNKEALQKETLLENYDEILVGRHNFSLQWISWEYFGSAYISKKGGNDLYEIQGEQKSKENDDYIKISGDIKVINSKHLKFNGIITTKVNHLNDGSECIRNGSFDFKVSGERKYWRLQQMGNFCAKVTDYIDIFFTFKS